MRLRARAGAEEQLAEALRQARQLIGAEPGCVYYDVFQPADDKAVFYLLEKYASKSALKAHLQEPHTREIGARFEALLESPPEIVLLSELV